MEVKTKNNPFKCQKVKKKLTWVRGKEINKVLDNSDGIINVLSIYWWVGSAEGWWTGSAARHSIHLSCLGLVLSWSLGLVLSWSLCLVLSWSLCLILSWSLCLVLSWSLCLVLSWSLCLALSGSLSSPVLKLVSCPVFLLCSWLRACRLGCLVLSCSSVLFWCLYLVFLGFCLVAWCLDLWLGASILICLNA